MSVENFLEQFGNVVVECPVGKSPDQMTLGELNRLEIGQKLVGSMATSHAALVESGMGAEQALTILGGNALVRDEQENIMGLGEPLIDNVPADADAKKKLMNPFSNSPAQAT